MADYMREHYDNPANQNVVQARKEFYNNAEPPVDFFAELVKCIIRSGRITASNSSGKVESVVDVGAGRGFILPIFRQAGYEGLYIGLDRSYNQIEPSKQEPLFGEPNTQMFQSAAEKLPIKDESADVMLKILVDQHQNRKQRLLSHREMQRGLRPSGIIGVVDSGLNNKLTVRSHEAFNGHVADATPPDPTNLHYITEVALRERAPVYRGWYRTILIQRGYVVLDTEEKINSEILSIDTAYDRYQPVPERKAFEKGLRITKKSMMEAKEDGYPVIDYVHRTAVLYSQEPTGLPERIVLGG